MDAKPQSQIIDHIFQKVKEQVTRLIPPLSPQQRSAVIAEVTPLASPGFDFFFLVILSTSIATLGLITDSPAVIIGAMLVAPLMSPIIGIGLASITGNPILLRRSLSALLRGALLAILLSALITLINTYLPIISLQSLPNEVTVRTHPSPIDLVIALAGGLAAAYALTQPNLSAALPGVAIATALMPPLCTVGIGIALQRWEVAGGALLLFVTNAITIAFASALVFFLRGFGASLNVNQPRVPRSLVLSAGLVAVLLLPLSYFSVQFFQNASEDRRINTIVADDVARMNGAELVEMDVTHDGNSLDMNITIRTSALLRYAQVVALQEALVTDLDRPISLKVNQVFAEHLDPLIPPTFTSTPTPTYTSTSGPSPTATETPTGTPTNSPLPPTATETPLPTDTSTPTRTPQPVSAIQDRLPAMQIYQSPGGPAIGILRSSQPITLLQQQQIFDGLVWVLVIDADGRQGWIPEIYLATLTPSPTPTASRTPSPTPTTSPGLSPTS